MLEQNFQSVYEKFKLQFFRRLFSQVREREGSLSAMEAFSVEVIHELDAPTIGQFADFLGISQSNATYKVNSLIRKGYIVKENSDTDRREYHLKLSDKFYCYNGLMQSYIDTVMARIHERFTPEELATFEHVLAVMSDELMPECDVPKKVTTRPEDRRQPDWLPPVFVCGGRQRFLLAVSVIRPWLPCVRGGFGLNPGRAEAQGRSPACVTSGTPSVFLYLRAKCGLIRKENDRNGASP